MTIETTNTCWVVVARSKDLRGKPISVSFNGYAVVLFRDKAGISALEDRCPHRGTPLSLGKVVKENLIECPYHGWKFDKDGVAIEIPGNENFKADNSCAVLKSFEAVEECELIWIRKERGGNHLRYIPPIHNTHSFFTLCTTIKANIIDIAENFLAALHTHFVHSGVIRSKFKERHSCKVEVQNVDSGYQATYFEEKQQTGIVSMLFGKSIVKSVGRIRYPGIIEIEYHSNIGVELSVVIYIHEERGGQCRLIIRCYLKKGKVPFILKAMVLLPFQMLTFFQDKRILEVVQNSVSECSEFKPMIVYTDILRSYIVKALNNDIRDIFIEKRIRL